MTSTRPRRSRRARVPKRVPGPMSSPQRARTSPRRAAGMRGPWPRIVRICCAGRAKRPRLSSGELMPVTLFEVRASDLGAARSVDDDGHGGGTSCALVPRLAVADAVGVGGEAGPDLVDGVDVVGARAGRVLVVAIGVAGAAGGLVDVRAIGRVRCEARDVDRDEGPAVRRADHLSMAGDAHAGTGGEGVEVSARHLRRASGRRPGERGSENEDASAGEDLAPGEGATHGVSPCITWVAISTHDI